jgi:hypothetical protein
VQPGGAYRYPYTVTEDVAWSTSSNVRVPLNRPFITDVTFDVGVQAPPLRVGAGCEWRLKIMKKPTWTVVPWDRVVFSGAFELIEVILDEVQ